LDALTVEATHERVLRRFLAGKLTKPWLMAVKRGWSAMVASLKIGSRERNEQVFEGLRKFVTNLDEQLRFLHQGHTVLTTMEERGKQFEALKTKLLEGIKTLEERANKLRMDGDFFNERYHFAVDRIVQEKGGQKGHGLYSLIPKEEFDHVVTLDSEDAVYVKHFPEVEESLKQMRHAGKVYDTYVQSGFQDDLKKLTRVFDAMMKVLYEDAKAIKELEDQGQEMGDVDTFTTFDLYGVKVVVDDATVRPIQVRQYIKYLDEAYSNLKRKGLIKVWYGTFFIKCQDCGGFNQNTQRWNDVGGNYPIGPDVVNIFSRPSSFIVELVTHELGHRYWFKFMNQAQRGKFESLVKVHRLPKPNKVGLPRTIPDEKVKEARESVETVAKELRAALEAMRTSKKKWFADIIREHVPPLGRAGWTFSSDMISAVHKAGADSQINPEVKKLFDDVLKTTEAVRKQTFDFETEVTNEIHAEPELTEAPKSRDKYWMGVYTRVITKWIAKIENSIQTAMATALSYINEAVHAYNAVEEGRSGKLQKEYDEELGKDDRPVPSVSNYGQSNIDEAFAEAFLHYVVEMDMSQDQIESFRSVLKTATINERVADRFLARLEAP
jgi:hypothetical protein